MRISRVTFRTNAQVAPFRHEHVECTVDLNEGDSPDGAFSLAKSFVQDKLEITPVSQAEVDRAKRTLASARKQNLLRDDEDDDE